MPFPVTLVTPEKVLFEGEASIVVARGLTGELGILTGHAPILVALDVGALFIRTADGEEVKAAIHGGFLDMRDNVCTILADIAELSSEIDAYRARSAQERAERRLAEAEDTDAAAALRRALVRVRVGGA